MLRKRISVLVTSFAILAGGLTFGAAPASAAISGAGIDPSTWAAGSTVDTLVTWTESDATANNGTSRNTYAAGGQYLSVEVGWGWTMANKNPSNAAVPYTATWSAGTKQYSCNTTPPIVFSSQGFGGAGDGNIQCLVRRSSLDQNNASDPGQQVVLSNTNTNYFTLAAGSTITVGFAGGQVTAPASGPAADTWRIISLAYGPSGSTTGKTTTVRTVVPGPDGALPEPPPTIRLDINGNGGVCTPSFVEGEQGTWGKAPTADKCTFGSRQLQGFSTSPTLAPGSVFVPPGGSVYFLTANLLYAIWASSPASAPQDVVATPGLNSVKVTWKAPADPGSSSITNYLAQATPSGKVCVTRLSDANMLSCNFDLPATNTKYAFKVQALNSAGWGQLSTESAAVSPYDFRDISASRPNILLGLGGSRVEASGLAPGLAGKAVDAQFKVGSAKGWTTQANAATVNAQGKFSWSRKFGPSLNKQNVSVRFTYGTDLVSGTYVLSRGGQAGSLTAPRNIKVENAVNRVIVTWDPPKFDGGEKITGYTMCAAGAGTLCRNVSTDGRGIFQGLDPRRTYTITVAAKTATRTGPAAEANQKVSPVEASAQITRRIGEEITVQTRAIGFKDGAKFRLEVAIAVPGKPTSSWGWDELQSFTGKGNVNRSFAEELGASYEGESIAVRLVTPNGTVYSRLSRP